MTRRITAVLLACFALSSLALAASYVVDKTGSFSDPLYDVHFINATTGWVVGAKGMVARTTNAGNTWTTSTIGGPGNTWYDIHFFPGNTNYGILVGDDGGKGSIFRTTNGGVSWTSDYSSSGAVYPFYCGTQIDTSYRMAAGDLVGGSYNAYYNHGTWTGTSIGSSAPTIYGLSFSGSTGFAAGERLDPISTNPGLWKSTDDGKNWTALSGYKESQPLRDVHALDTTTVWAVGNAQIATRTTNGGTDWPTLNSGITSGNLRGVHFSSNKLGWIVGTGGVIYRTETGNDANPSWSVVSSGTTIDLEGVYAHDENNVWFVGGGSAFIGKWVVDPAVTQAVQSGTTIAQAPQGWTGNVSVSGALFQEGLTVGSVSFGSGITINSVTRHNASSLTVNLSVASGATVGNRNVTVTNPDTGSGAKSNGFQVTAPPTVTNAVQQGTSIGQAPQGWSGYVTVNGTSFQNGVTIGSVSFGFGVSVNSVSYVSPTQLTVGIAVDSGAAAGERTVSVTNPDSGSGSLAAAFKITNRPTASSLDLNGRPDRPLNWSGPFTINGANFQAGATVTGDDPAIVISVGGVTGAAITGTITLGLGGNRKITVTNPDGGSDDVYAVVNPLPTVTSVNPSTMTQGETGDVVIMGSGFQNGISSTDLAFSLAGITVNSVAYNSQYQLTANITVSLSGATGTGNLTVTNPDSGSGTGSGFFSVSPAGITPPLVTAVTPDNAEQGQTLNVTVTGSNFHAGPPTVSFGNGGITVNSVTFNSAASLTVDLTIAAGAATTARTVTVTNIDDGGIGSKSGAFRVTAPGVVDPTIDRVVAGHTYASPEAASSGLLASAAYGEKFILNGTGFQNGATISFDPNLIVLSVEYLSPTQLRFFLRPTSRYGMYDISVLNPDGGSGGQTSAFEVRQATDTAELAPVPGFGRIGLASPNPWRSGPLTLQWEQTKAAEVTISGHRIDGIKLFQTPAIAGGPGYNKYTIDDPDFSDQHLLANQILLFLIKSEGKVLGKIKVMRERQ